MGARLRSAAARLRRPSCGLLGRHAPPSPEPPSLRVPRFRITNTAGWFCNAIPSVSRFSNVEVLRGGEWRPLAVPPAVKALVVVNLQSYGGGRNIWGDKMKPEKARRQGFVQPSVDDGMIEVGGAGAVPFRFLKGAREGSAWADKLEPE